jgi:hypothetical protein
MDMDLHGDGEENSFQWVCRKAMKKIGPEAVLQLLCVRTIALHGSTNAFLSGRTREPDECATLIADLLMSILQMQTLLGIDDGTILESLEVSKVRLMGEIGL